MEKVSAKLFSTFLLTFITVGYLPYIHGHMLQLCDEAVNRTTPKVLLGTKAHDYTPFNHLEYTVSSWTWNAFTFNCWAPFPIRWTFDFDQNDGDVVRNISVFQSRTFTDFRDNSTYEYRSILTFHYETLVTKEQVFSCQAVSSPCDRRFILVKPVDQGRRLRIRWVPDLNLPQLEENLQPQLAENKTCRVSFNYINIKGAWYFCCASAKAFYDRGIPMFFPSFDANTLENIQKHSYIQSEKCIKEIGNHSFCPNGFTVNTTQAMAIACDLEKSTTFSMNAVYFGLEQDDDDQQPPPIYFNWFKIDPEKMMKLELEVTNPLKAYINQSVNITCYISVAYFSHGGFIATYDPKNNLTIYKSNTTELTEPYVTKMNAYKIEFQVLITKTTEKVYCFAPIWNSTEWINKSVPVTVLEPPPFEIVNASSIETIIWSEVNIRPTLTCVANGFPTPKVEWRFLTQALTTETQDSGFANVESVLTFLKVDKSVEGDYRCRASNTMGDAEKLFHVKFQTVSASRMNTTAVSSIGAAGLFIACVLLSVLVHLRKKNAQQRKQIEFLTALDVTNFRNGTPCAPNDPSYNSNFEIPRDDLLINETDLLGSGAFGRVYKGQKVISPVGSPLNLVSVAIKTVPRNVDIIYFNAILSEIKIMSSIRTHNNVMKLMGACTSNIAQREVYMAVEFCANGNLKSQLQKRRTFTQTAADYQDAIAVMEPALDPNLAPQLNRWACEIAAGMNFLASSQIVHGDLAARNIFLSESLVAKIGDFGLARVLAGCSVYVKKPTTCPPLPWKWMAIESLDHLEFSLKTDVWSFGMVLWEIFSLAETPYPGLSWTTQFVNGLKDGMREGQPKFASAQLYAIILECWKTIPEERPTFSTLQEMLQ